MTDLRGPGSRAILLGASSYDSDQLADVPAVVDTVNDLRTALIQRCGMSRESITDLRDRTDAHQVMAAVAREAQRTTGVLLVHYVGHGLTGQHGELYLSVGGTDPAPEYGRREHTAIPYAEVARQLAKGRALAIVVILDCCFSGRALPRDDPAGRGPGIPAGPGGGVVITSAAREEHAIARDGDKYTAFTGRLLTLLNEGDADGPGGLTLRATCDYLDRALDERLPRPLWMFTGAADNITLTDNRGYLSATVTSPVQVFPPAVTAETPPEPALAPAAPAPIPVPSGPPRPPAPGIRSWAGGIGRPGARRRVLSVAGVVLLAAAGLGAFLASQPDHAAANTPEPTKTNSAKPAAATTSIPSNCGQGTITLIGGAFGPIAGEAADAYKKVCKGATINLNYGQGKDSAYGVTQVAQAVSSHSTLAGSMIAMYDGTTTTLAKGLTPVPVGVFIYSVVAHAGLLPGSNITVPQLKQLYTRGLPNKVGVGHANGSGTRQALFALWGQQLRDVKAPGACPPPSGHAVTFPDCTSTSMLAFVDGTPNAIGYQAVNHTVSGYPTDYPQTTTIYAHTSIISVNGAAPTPENVRNGSYPFVAVEHLYRSPHPTALAQSFIQYLHQYLASQSSQSIPDFTTCSNLPEAIAAKCAA